MIKKVLFVGLGNMGLPMALNLLKAGYQVQGFDLFPKGRESFEKAGGIWLKDFTNPDADLLIAMLPGGLEMKALYLEKQKLFSVLKKGTLVLDCSTADPEDVNLIYEAAKKKGLPFLSAPVSGGVKGAEAGTLTFMLGGEREDLEKVRPLLKVMGKNIFHAGGSSAGQIVKICNNMLLAIHMIGTCEALALGEALGLKPEILNQILKSSSGNNWSLEKYNPYPGLMDSSPASHNYEGGFSVRLMLKDLGLSQNSLKRVGQKAELGEKAFQMYKEHAEAGFSSKDFSHIFKKIQKSGL